MLNLDTQQSQARLRAGEARISMQSATEMVVENLGCGLAIAAYEPVKRIGGLLHAFLPSCALDKAKGDTLPYIFVDSGLRHFLRIFKKMNVDLNALEIKIAGGADVLQNESGVSIGQENIAVARAVLEEHKLAVKNSATGGTISLGMTLRLSTGAVTVSLRGYEDIIL